MFPKESKRGEIMGIQIRRAPYFHATVQDRPGEAYRMLDSLAALNVNLVAFTAVPVGPDRTQLTLFPDDSGRLSSVADGAGLQLDGPHHAFWVGGADEPGALAGIHEKLYNAGVNVYASTGVSDGAGHFGYVIYVRPHSYSAAAEALGL